MAMATCEFLRKMAAKHRAAKAAEREAAQLWEECPEAPDVPDVPDDPPVPAPKREPTPLTTPTMNLKARKGAESRCRNRFGRSREDVQAILRRDYAEKGPTLLAQELGMNVTTVMMRARRMGLSADPDRSVQRRTETRRKRQTSESEDGTRQLRDNQRK